MDKTRILVIDDDQSMVDLAEYYLRSQGYEVSSAQTGEEGLRLLDESRFDVVLTDLQLPDIDGIEVVGRIKQAFPEIEIIMISGHGSVAKAVEATKAGAFYFVEKPVELDELALLIAKAIERRQQAQEIKQLRGRLTSRNSYYDLIGGSKAMQNIYETIESVADSDASVLIIGESGTGKELIANAIHYKSLRSRKQFVKINCSALPRELIESELFGHTKGAFTGATGDKTGLLSRADGGSLLLDEISEMPLELQPKLLRVLQERVFYRLGSEKAQQADFRLISATNRKPSDAIRDGCLRDDLYYRINTIEIIVPPLRERVDDIQHLAEHFVHEFAAKYQKPVTAISGESYQRLFDHPWPGNVRELRHVVERATLLSKGETLDIGELSGEAPPARVMAAAAAASKVAHSSPSDSNNSSSSVPLGSSKHSFDEIGEIIIDQVPDPKSGGAPVDVFGQIERAVVGAALKRTRGNKQAAANLLGLYRPRLYSMIKKHDLMGVNSHEGKPKTREANVSAPGPDAASSADSAAVSSDTASSDDPDSTAVVGSSAASSADSTAAG